MEPRVLLTQREADVCKLKKKVSKLEESIALERSTSRNVLKQKDEGERELQLAEETLQANKCLLKSTQHQLACMQGHLADKINECTQLQADHQLLVQKKIEGSRLQHQDLLKQLSAAVQLTDNIRREKGQLAAKALNLERTLGLAITTLEDIQGQCGTISLTVWQENQARKGAFYDLHELCMQYRQLQDMNCRLQPQWAASSVEILDIEKLEVEKVRLEMIIPESTLKQIDLDSTVPHRLADKELERTLLDMGTFLEGSGVQGQLIPNNCHHKPETIKAIEDQSNGHLDEKAQDVVNKLTRKNDVLLLALKSCLERENNTEIVCSEKSHLLDVTQHILNYTEERLNQEVEKLTVIENSMLETKQRTELELEGNQAEIKRHLKEIAARNDKEMGESRMKLEGETMEPMMQGDLQVRKLLAARDMRKKSMITQNRDEPTKCVLDILKPQKERNVEVKLLKEQKKLLLVEEKTKVGKLQEETGLICQKFEFASVQERELHVKLTKCEEALNGMGLEYLRIQEEHENEIARLFHSFHENLEEGTRGTLIWELKCKAMGKEIQQLRDKSRYEAERETCGGTLCKSIAHMETISSRQFDHAQVVHSQADKILEEETLSETQFQGLRFCGNMKQTRQVDRSIDILNERLSSKCDKEVSSPTYCYMTRVHPGKVTCYDRSVSIPFGRKRIKKRKKNLESVYVHLGTELEGLCGGVALDPYEGDI